MEQPDGPPVSKSVGVRPDPMPVSGRWKTPAVWVLGFLTCVGTIVPIILFRYPAIQDYPNHLARIFILRNADDPLLADNYRVLWELVPNLGWEGLVLPLAWLMPVELAGRLGLGLMILLLAAGMATLNRVIVGRWSSVPLLAAPLLFSQPLTWGFLAFDLGIGLALFSTAWWLALDERRWRVRLVGATVLSTLLFVTHLAAWAVYGVVLLGLQFERLGEARLTRGHLAAWTMRSGRDALQAVPAIVLLGLSFADRAEPSGAPAGFQDFQWPWIRIVRIFSIVDTGRPALTVVAVIFFISVIAFGIYRGALTPAGRMRIPLLLLLVLFFCLPDKIAAMTHVSIRPLMGLAIWGMASMRPGPAWDPFAARLSAAIAAIVLLIGCSRLPSWVRTQDEVAAFARLVQDIPEGGRLYFIHAGIDGNDIRARQAGVYHEASYAVLWKKLLVQSMFAYPGQQPLRFRLLADQLLISNAQPVLKDLEADLSRRGVAFGSQIAGFQNLVIHGPPTGSERQLAPPDRFRLVRSENDLRLYQRLSDAAATSEPLQRGRD